MCKHFASESCLFDSVIETDQIRASGPLYESEQNQQKRVKVFCGERMMGTFS